MSELVSIILPVYNGAEVAGRAIESVLSQTYRDIELVIIDDGSTDESLSVCQKYANEYPHIHIYSINNQGVSNARNYGIKVASGKYITFLDVDDQFLPESVSSLVEILNSSRADVACVNACYVDNGKDITKMSEFKPSYSLIENKKERDLLIRQLYTDTPGFYYGDYLRASWAKIYKADLLKANKITFPIGVPIGEDAIFLLQVFQNAKRIVMKNEYLYKYYRSDASVTGRYTSGYYDKKLTEYFALKKTLDLMNYQIQDIDLIFWHRTSFEFVGNTLKADNGAIWKINSIRGFLKSPYPNEYLAIPFMPGKKDKIRAFLVKHKLFLLLALIEYVSKKNKM